jgi:hypothetical protein
MALGVLIAMNETGSSVKIEDLFWLAERQSFAAKPEMDPLTEDDSLTESQLIDVRFDTVTSTVGLLFDLRQAMQLRLASTGVLIVHDVEGMAWKLRLHEIEKEAFAKTWRPRRYQAWNVMASELRPTDLFNLKVVFEPGAELSVSGASAEFFMGDVPGIGEVAASYSDATVDAIESSLQHWGSHIQILYATFVDRKES